MNVRVFALSGSMLFALVASGCVAEDDVEADESVTVHSAELLSEGWELLQEPTTDQPGRAVVMQVNGAASDSAVIQSAIDAATDGGTLPGIVHLLATSEGPANDSHFRIDEPIQVQSHLTLIGAGPSGSLSPLRMMRPIRSRAECEAQGISDRKCNNNYVFTSYNRRIDDVHFESLSIGGNRGTLETPPADLAFYRNIAFQLIRSSGISDYNQDITLRDIEVTQMAGVCTLMAGVDGFALTRVRCFAPTKGGIVFGNGARNGTVDDCEVQTSGDDALAFNATNSYTELEDPYAEYVRDVTVSGGKFSQHLASPAGGSVALRGAQNILLRESQTDGSKIVIGPGNANGALFVANQFKPNGSWNPSGNVCQNCMINNRTLMRLEAPFEVGATNGIFLWIRPNTYTGELYDGVALTLTTTEQGGTKIRYDLAGEHPGMLDGPNKGFGAFLTKDAKPSQLVLESPSFVPNNPSFNRNK